MKYIFTFFALLFGVMIPFQFALSQSHPADGPYIGIDGSYDLLKDNISATGDNVYSTNEPAVGIFAGFRQTQGQFTVAAEIRYGYSFARKEQTVAPFDAFAMTHEFGAAVLPGYWLNDQLLVYGRLGYNHATLIDTINAVDFSNGDSSVEFGGGIEIFATPSVSLRLEYTRTAFEGMTILTFNNVNYNDWKIRRDRFRAAITTAF